MIVGFQFISGLMVGIEIIWGEGLVLDLGIIRVVFIKGDFNNDE